MIAPRCAHGCCARSSSEVSGAPAWTLCSATCARSSGGPAQTGSPLPRSSTRWRGRGKSLEVTDALVEDILGLGYGGGRTWAVLATLFDHVDTRMQYHVDHVFPKAQLDSKALKAAKNYDRARRYTDAKVDELVARRDLLPNLELLPGPENVGKHGA